jgi:ATP-binding cassette, subfamily C, bacterial LapB
VTTAANEPGRTADGWARALAAAAEGFELSPSVEQTRLMLLADGAPRPETIRRAAEACGLDGRFVTVRPRQRANLCPFIADVGGGEIILVRSITAEHAQIAIVADGALLERTVECSWLDGVRAGPVLALAPRGRLAATRIDAYLAPYKRSWFRSLLMRHMARFFELAGGALCANVLALATAIFAMQIWDRVIPAQSLPTLWVLTLGVGLALAFELIIKQMRVSVADQFGKELDIRMSSMFFARALDLRNDQRPRSPGTLIAQLRELDQIRELLTSTTLSVLFEIPFVLTFVFVIALIGGPLVYVVLGVIPIVLLLCLLVQWPMARLSRAGLRESALRNAMLVESIERIEDIKSLQAEARFVALWERVNTESARIGKQNRFLSSLLTNTTQTLQQGAYVAVLVAGVYLVLANQMTTGALLACSMLTSRAISPLAQIAGVFARLQGARVARQGLDALLQVPTDHGGATSRFHRPMLKPDLQFEQIAHAYDKDQRPALTIPRLSIAAGERVAVIGRIGSGKSTLLKLAAGLMPPSAGRVLIDGTDMRAIEMADVRRDIGSYHQDAGLFVGTVRSNLQMGASGATDEDLLAALTAVGASAQIFTDGHGLDMTVQEGGRGLSSGQRQALILARTLVRSPRALLLDEPTGSLDENTERTFVTGLKAWLGTRTLIVATHRYALLDIVDRVIVVDGGRIALDGPRSEIVQKLSQPLAAPADLRAVKTALRTPALVHALPQTGTTNGT